MTELQAALDRGDLEGAMRAVPWAELDAAKAEITKQITSVLEQAGLLALMYLPKDVVIDFSVANPAAIAWIEARAAELVTNISTSAQQAIRDLIADAFKNGTPLRDFAMRIRGCIGLTTRMAAAVERYRQEMIELYGEARAAVLADRYAKKLIRYRADVIAKNETMVAANEGQRELWRQGVEQGQIDPNEWERTWIVTPDDRLCDLCAPMADRRAALPTGNYPDDGVGPPLHVICRCVEGLVEKERIQ